MSREQSIDGALLRPADACMATTPKGSETKHDKSSDTFFLF
jgi:hypothetical protein